MALEFKLPDIGEGLTEGEITKWLVKEGQQVAADQPMVEVMTDKATVEIPSPVAGTVVAAIALLSGWGHARMARGRLLGSGEPVRVAVLQGNVAPPRLQIQRFAPRRLRFLVEEPVDEN